jgi:uncharacterized damage-inducible protein DinB
MNEISRIQDQLKRAFEGEAWHGPSVKEVLAGVTAEMADARPIPKAHTIRELVLHIRAWQNGVRRRREGEKVDLTPEEDWPVSQATWEQELEALENDYNRLQASVSKLTDEDLQNHYMQLHGVIQHNLFHAGQIVILKK